MCSCSNESSSDRCRPDGLPSGQIAKPMKGSIPLAFNAAGLMVPEPSLMLPTPFKACVGWRAGG